MNIQPQSSPLRDHEYRGDPLSPREKKNGVKQIELNPESNQFEKRSKVGINEMFSNC